MEWINAENRQTQKNVSRKEFAADTTFVAEKRHRTAFEDVTNQHTQGNVDAYHRGRFRVEQTYAPEGQENVPVFLKNVAANVPPPNPQQDPAYYKISQAHEVPNPTPFLIDIDDHNDVLKNPHIAEDIMRNLFISERSKRPLSNYMTEVQVDITSSMRGILVDWLIEVAQEYKLSPETLYQTISLIDRYLSVAPVQRQQLQLVGVSCMFIASKYEEIYPPQVSEFSFITEETYSKKDIINCECEVLNGLDFQLTSPTVWVFLKRFLQAAAAVFPPNQMDNRMEPLSAYIAELSLLEIDCIKFLPSQIAASALLLAKFCIHGTGWHPNLEFHTSYSAKDLKFCVQYLHRNFLRARTNELPAIRDKYCSMKYACVSNANPPLVLPAKLFIRGVY